MDAVPDTEVKVVLPDTSQISDDLKTKFHSKMHAFMEARQANAPEDAPIAIAVTTTTPSSKSSKTATPMYEEQSIDNVQEEHEQAANAEPRAHESMPSPPSIDTQSSPLSQSTTDVS